jgi:hypothetical protein
MAPPTSSQVLATISPARLERLLACPLRVAFEQARPGASQQQVAPWALVGFAVHRTIELCLADPPVALADAWDQACEELSKEGDDPRAVPNARRSLLRLERRLPELLSYIADRAPAEKLREYVLTSPDGVVTGQLDLLVLGERPSVIDHKTGLVLAEGLPRPHYERQLAIYAWLVQAALDVDVNDGALFSLREGVVELDVSTKVRDSIVAVALRARDAFNERAPGAQPATPSDRACGSCPFVGPCDVAWDALRTGAVERFGWGDAARATVRAPIVVAAGGTAAVPLDIEIGTVGGPAVLIDVPAPLIDGLTIGARLSAWRLAKRSDEPLMLAWREGISSMDLVEP